MTHFQPSYHSHVDYTRYNYDLAGYGAADVSRFLPWIVDDESSQGAGTVDVKDIPGDTFRVSSSGIEVMSGSAAGRVFSSGNAVYDQMLKNLMDVRGNRAKIESVIGSSALETSLASSPLVTSSGAPPATVEAVIAATPFYQQAWFLPTVIGVGTLVVIGGIVWSTR